MDGPACMIHFTFSTFVMFINLLIHFTFSTFVMFINLLLCILPLLSPIIHPSIPTNYIDGMGSSKGKEMCVDD